MRYRDAIDLTPHGHPDEPSHLRNLGNSLFSRFERLGELSDLEDAISRFRDAIGLISHGHPEEPTYLNNLGRFLVTRFERCGEPTDLDDAISMLRDAVDLTPLGHPWKSTCLSSLGDSFFTRFRRFGELSDLEDSISRHKDALDLIPHDHRDKPICLNNLGKSFVTRFERLGELSDLETSISMFMDAVDLTPRGRPEKADYLNNLGNSFKVRYDRLGELSDLEDAISKHREAADLTPHDHPRKPTSLGNLGNSLTTRFRRLGELGDLEDAISMYRDAIDLTPNGHPDKFSHLNHLGDSLFTRFEHSGEPNGLEDAISMLRDAVDLTPLGHHLKPTCLNNLGNSLFTRFKRLGELSDLEDAISTLRDTVNIIPHGHSHKPASLGNLGNSFLARFERLGGLSDLEDAISRHRDAFDLTPHGHPHMVIHLNNLGNCFRARFEHFGDPRDLKQAISLYSRVASTPTGRVSVRFHASRNWISCARRIRHHSLLHAHSVAVNLLPQLAWIGLSLRNRYHELLQGADVVREAVAAALDSGLLETAVEWLEQGRSIIWGELFQLRSSYEELSSAHPDHALKLRELSAALEYASANRETSSSSHLEQPRSATHRTTESLQQEADRHRMLAIERDKLLLEIRSFPGFEGFLLRKQFSQLHASTHSSPVVLLNAAESRCDALIVLADVNHVIHVPLPNFTFQRSTGLQNMLEKLLGHARVLLSDDRKGDPATLCGVSWESLLSTLWNGIVKPVLDALAFSTPGDLSRIFWCPTGPFVFLPIHAAGLYDTQHSQPGHKVSDFVVSSYAPTLSILALSSNPAAAPSGDLRLLAVRQPSSDGLPRLPGVDTELKHIKAVIRHSPSRCITLMESSAGTVEEVLSLMKEADWVHFACHGIQDDVNSGLCLADRRRLKISDVIALSRPRGGLAFLSACQTAMGEALLSDEALHIAAGMLFAGYGGVIGTMWSISDELAPGVARDVYAQLFRNGARPDHRGAARALHGAIGRLRESGKASFVTWLPFIHVGL
ncbi:hypothetical protein OG21DRAFT_1416340 [Imleria badia]|nr:hypothetical protein OG21DRAFT_1416340 [Imleria badia]